MTGTTRGAVCVAFVPKVLLLVCFTARYSTARLLYKVRAPCCPPLTCGGGQAGRHCHACTGLGNCDNSENTHLVSCSSTRLFSAPVSASLSPNSLDSNVRTSFTDTRHRVSDDHACSPRNDGSPGDAGAASRGTHTTTQKHPWADIVNCDALAGKWLQSGGRTRASVVECRECAYCVSA